MLLRSRQIQATGGEIIDIPTSWSWDSYQQSQPGYMLWVVFKGELTVQTTSNSWNLRTGHVLSIPTDKDAFKAMNRSSGESTVGWTQYRDLTESPRIPARSWIVSDMALFTSLYNRMNARLKMQELWEATAVLSVLLDELAEQKTVTATTSLRSSETSTAQLSAIQKKLQGIDWSRTQSINVKYPGQ
jgi:mannose-6-phosphate isomerase class I